MNPFSYVKHKITGNNSAQNININEKDFIFGRVLNALQSTFRRAFSSNPHGVSPDGKRDYFALYGYGSDLSYSQYFWMYKRGGIANVIVGKVAKACWRDMPELWVGDNRVLENEMNVLANLGMLKSLERADILNRIGKYSVLMVGVPDSENLNLPVGSSSKNNIDGVFFRPYSEDGTTFTKWDTDPMSKRRGLPIEYQVMTTSQGEKTATVDQGSSLVHWSRIVHMAEGALDSDVEGCSALEAAWNIFIDIMKSRGGASEAFFRNARQKFAQSSKTGFEGLAENDAALKLLKEQTKAFTDELQDFMITEGMDTQIFQPNMASPRDTFDICVEEVAGTYGIAIRILTGKGGGQLAGSEDRASWNALIGDRQMQESTPSLLRTLNILDDANIIQLPENVVVKWPAQSALSEKEQAEILDLKSKSFAAIVNALNLIGEDIPLDDIAKATDLKNINFDQINSNED